MIKSYKVWINGKEFLVEVEEMGGTAHTYPSPAPPPSPSQPVSSQPASTPAKAPPIKAPQIKEPPAETMSSASKTRDITAPMSGLVIDVLAMPGMRVKPGTKLLVLEAMKMENDIVCDVEGLVQEVLTRKGDSVETGQTLVKVSVS